MKPFFVLRSLFLVPRSWIAVLVCAPFVQTVAADQKPSTKNQEPGTAVAEPRTKNQEPSVTRQTTRGSPQGSAAHQQGTEPFRPEPGKFPPLEKAHSYRGELVFVDHANRRGSIRLQGSGMFFRNDPHPFAMLPYGIVRYHGAPADLRDIPLGTVLHVRAFLPPDPKISAVPVLPVNNKDIDAKGYRGTGIFPAQNHVLLLEDEPSHCQREGLTWKLKEVEIKNAAGLIIATREPKTGSAPPTTRRRGTRPSSAAAGCPRGLTMSSMANLAAPP